MALMQGARTCNLVSPARMNEKQRGQYEEAHIFLEQLGERLVEAGDFSYEAVSIIDKIARMR